MISIEPLDYPGAPERFQPTHVSLDVSLIVPARNANASLLELLLVHARGIPAGIAGKFSNAVIGRTAA